MGRLQAKRTIITGAGSGIGRATSKAFAREGASILCVDKTDAVHETVEMILAAGGHAIGMTADVGVEAEVIDYVDRAIAEFGGLDIIYANAGISGGMVPFFDQTVDYWNEILRVNLIGPFLAIKHVAPHLIKQGKGSIICTASVAGIRANAGGSPYSASKAGVISLVQTSSNAFYGTGVRVNAVCPGFVGTDWFRNAFGDEVFEKIFAAQKLNTPMARAGGPEDIKGPILFFANRMSAHVTGQLMVADAGLLLGMPFEIG